MQHAHVKRKENQMNTLSKEGFYIEPGTVAAMEARARRARAQAMHSLILRLFAGLAPRLEIRPVHWIERLG